MHPVTITSLVTGNLEPFPAYVADTATSWAGHLSITGLTQRQTTINTYGQF